MNALMEKLIEKGVDFFLMVGGALVLVAVITTLLGGNVIDVVNAMGAL